MTKEAPVVIIKISIEKNSGVVTIKSKTILTLLLVIAIIASTFFNVYFSFIRPGAIYSKANALLEDGKPDEALELFISIHSYKDSEDKIELAQREIQNKSIYKDYKQAVELLNSGDTHSALEILNRIGTEDAALKVSEFNKSMDGAVPELNLQKGDYFYLGAYEQDNRAETGKDAIEWQVIAVEGNRALVISTYALETLPYHEENTSVTWETSYIRSWLNGEFINKAFTPKQQEIILPSNVSNSKVNSFGIHGGNDTVDKVFLLSLEEAESCFDENIHRETKTTVAASTKLDGSCHWWLRSPGSTGNEAAYVAINGQAVKGGNIVSNANGGIRPAMWIKIY